MREERPVERGGGGPKAGSCPSRGEAQGRGKAQGGGEVQGRGSPQSGGEALGQGEGGPSARERSPRKPQGAAGSWLCRFRGSSVVCEATPVLRAFPQSSSRGVVCKRRPIFFP